MKKLPEHCSFAKSFYKKRGSEIEESLERILKEYCPKLSIGDIDNFSEQRLEEVFDTLHAIREELRHVTYHIQDSEFLKSRI